ncbi:MAG: 4Fe-4S dicluster domain-containing protein [Wolinella sp.]
MAKKYGMIHDENLCIGCQACSIACRSENNIPDGVYRLQVWVQGPKRLNDGSLSFNYHRQSCVQCDNTPCVTVCPTKASYVNQDGIVSIDVDLCVGCLYCVAACPYQARYVDPVTKAPDKCNFCKDTRLARGEEPACVTVCPTDALTFGGINNPNSPISKKLARNVSVRPKESLGTQPKLYIIPNKRGGIES